METKYVDEEAKGFNVLGMIDKKLRFFIIGMIIFMVYLVSTTQLISNTQEVCNLDINGCNGTIKEIEETKECCNTGIIYSPDDFVPKKHITWNMALIMIIGYIATIIMIIRNVHTYRILNVEEAKEVVSLYMKQNRINFEFTPTSKLRYFHNSQKPFKWVIGADIINDDGTKSYGQAYVKALWESNRKADHFLGYTKRYTQLRGDHTDKDEVYDIIWIESASTQMEKKYRESTKQKQN